jgi:cytochrome c oxidase cbb3-type subunit 3
MSSNEEKNLILEQEQHLVLDHNYDGIQELDHPLPDWWLWTFIGGFVFAFFYFILYQFMGAPTLQDEFEKDYAKVLVKKAAYEEQYGNFDMESYLTWKGDEKNMGQGLKVYEENCAACHLEKGIGDIGPNLTDNYWIHEDGKPESLYTMIRNGYEDNGMPAWKEMLSNEDILSVMVYVESLRNTFVEGGKEAQGEKVED